MKIIVLVGISGSGKSTFASTTVRHNPERYVTLSRDKVRELIYGYTESDVHEYYGRNDFNYMERQVSDTLDVLISFWLKKGKDVIVDNTHLKRKYIEEYDKFGVDVETIFFGVDLDVAIERDSKRVRRVGEDVIRRQFKQCGSLL